MSMRESVCRCIKFACYVVFKCVMRWCAFDVCEATCARKRERERLNCLRLTEREKAKERDCHCVYEKEREIERDSVFVKYI